VNIPHYVAKYFYRGYRKTHSLLLSDSYLYFLPFWAEIPKKSINTGTVSIFDHINERLNVFSSMRRENSVVFKADGSSTDKP
jgi:hypothetical protein